MICTGHESRSAFLSFSRAHVAVAAEVLQQLDLSQGALSQDLLAEDIGDFLDGYAVASLVVGRGAAGRKRQQLVQRSRRSAQDVVEEQGGRSGHTHQTMP